MLWELTRVQLESSLNVFRFALMQSSLYASAVVVNAIERYLSTLRLPNEMVDSLKSVGNIQSPLTSLGEIQRQLCKLISNNKLKFLKI